MVVFLRTETEIAAPPEVVRSVFLDFERYEEWRKDAFMPYAVTHPRGRPGLSLTKDDKLDTTFSGLKIQVTIIRNTPMEFRWAGSTLAGAFRGEHYFGFEESKTTPGTTNFIHGEDYAGWLSFLFKPGWPLRVSTMEMYAKFSQDLKERVEKVHLIGKPAMVNSE